MNGRTTDVHLSTKFELDEFDNKILSCLELDASLSNVSLANHVGLSESACLRRTKRLKDIGAIKRIVAIVDRGTEPDTLSVVVTLKLERHGTLHRKKLLQVVKSEPSIVRCDMVSGDVSCVMIVSVSNIDAYNAFAERVLKSDRNIQAFTSHFVLQTIKD
ncbi:Lrp/AsnC family transcriptional regulator [uncultured Ruegeria sp.]|uniref:Lrp/AsnC family transcriptional regulator n=1 Tax=uncultured Ruegeria sp. TaxID=259304 RepID=UPI00262E12AF|nr:Lrp/AsnC family transcriptional regulator [uncultured Ruegeria sp.]